VLLQQFNLGYFSQPDGRSTMVLCDPLRDHRQGRVRAKSGGLGSLLALEASGPSTRCANQEPRTATLLRSRSTLVRVLRYSESPTADDGTSIGIINEILL
jgi:hypothetical protein